MRDDSWFTLASNELGVPETILRDHAANGDSVSLAILIHIFRQQFSLSWNQPWLRDEFSNVLEATSKFNIQDTTLELQHEFCTLWNQIVLKAQTDDDRWIAWYVLRPIRHVYTALHGDIDSTPTQLSISIRDHDQILWRPSSYSLRNVPSHHLDSTPLTHDASEASKTLAYSVLRGYNALVPVNIDNALGIPIRTLFQYHFTLLTKPLLKANMFLPLHRTQLLHGEESTTLPDLCHLPSLNGLKLRHLSLLVPQLPLPAPFPLSTMYTLRLIPIHPTSYLYPLLIRFSKIYCLLHRLGKNIIP
ncbi:hypothetical protein EDB87DRAFT_98462 [Lactarius vividus]|nr:hypothetical protein EDB87DRAFT_98462 [Lactarius vividus]